MAVTEEKLKDAVSKIESVSTTLHSHIGAQSVVNASLTRDLEKNTEEIVKLRIDAEKKDGAIALVAADVKRLIELASTNRVGWQVWAAFGATVLIGLVNAIISVWPKGVTP